MTLSNETFQRVEKKYLLTPEQLDAILPLIENRVSPDARGQQSIRNLYYDTPDYAFIRHSIEKPVYKEKLRLRCYGETDENSAVYVEVKKKYKGIVYKRRATLPLFQAERFLNRAVFVLPEGQVLQEVRHLCQSFSLTPKVYLSYQRIALLGPLGSGLRITLDQDIRARMSQLSLMLPPGGVPLLPRAHALMEVKVPGAFPLWLSRTLSSLEIFPTSFSKIGQYYQHHLHPKSLLGGEKHHAAS